MTREVPHKTYSFQKTDRLLNAVSGTLPRRSTATTSEMLLRLNHMSFQSEHCTVDRLDKLDEHDRKHMSGPPFPCSSRCSWY